MRRTLVVLIVAFVFAGSAATAAERPWIPVPPATGRIAFQRVLFNRGRIAIFTIEADGTDVQRITFPAHGIETARPDWSPDGRRIAYMRANFPWDDSVPRHLLVVWADGSHRVDLTLGACAPPRCFGEEDPAWSPDADRIAFVRIVRKGASIFVMTRAGTERRPVTSPPSRRFADAAPSWSPPGDELVFARWDADRERSSLFVVALDGTAPRRITPWGDGLSRPDWSPDGRWIVFSRPDEAGLGKVLLVHPDGSGLHTITHGPRGGDWVWPAFSPDGRMIVAVRIPGEHSENDIYVMRRDGTGIRPVTTKLSTYPAEGLPDWGVP
jgi:Tol biopolymer transport system component